MTVYRHPALIGPFSRATAVAHKALQVISARHPGRFGPLADQAEIRPRNEAVVGVTARPEHKGTASGRGPQHERKAGSG